MKETLIGLTADIVAAHVSNNNVSVNEVAGIIRNVHDALSGLASPAPVEPPKAEPAVSIRASVKPDYIVCLEDGAKLKMLKRYLRTRFDMSPEDYRAKWGLPKDYPMVAPNYAEMRRGLAVKIGLGKSSKAEVKSPAPSAATAKPATESASPRKAPASAAKSAKAPAVKKAPADTAGAPKRRAASAKAAKPAAKPAAEGTATTPKAPRARKPKAAPEQAS